MEIHLLETYATDDVIAETDPRIMNFYQLLNRTPNQYAEVHWTKSLPAIKCTKISYYKVIYLRAKKTPAV